MACEEASWGRVSPCKVWLSSCWRRQLWGRLSLQEADLVSHPEPDIKESVRRSFNL